MILRDYQSAAITACWNYLRARDGNPCIVIPTGGGKTIIIAEMIRHALTQWPDTRIAVVAHVRELVRQNHDKLMAYWPGAPAGIHSAGLGRRDRFKPVIFASIQSVAKRAMQIGAFDLLLIDEAHHIPLHSEGQYRRFIADCRRANPRLRIAGLTATPYRLGGGPVCGPDYILNEIAFEARVRDLINHGYLCRLVSKAGAARADLSGVHLRNGEYIAGELERAVNRDSVVEAACDEIMRYCDNRRAWLVFCAGVEHAEHVTAALQARGVACAQVDGTTPKALRDDAIARFQRGQLRALVNINVLSEGFDATHVDAIVMMRPTKSAALYYQQVGRGMRLHPGKPDCLVLDFAGNIVEHGPVDAIRPPKKSGQKATSEAPVRECPACQALVPVQTRTCAECGYEWPLAAFFARHAGTASDAPILSDEIVPPAEHYVTAVNYARHEKKGKPPSLRVTYTCGLRVFREWVCLEHSGMARAKAMGWWMRRDSSGLTPRSVEAALKCTDRLKTPACIRVDERGKYPEIVEYLFDASSEAGKTPPHNSFANVTQGDRGDPGEPQLPGVRALDGWVLREMEESRSDGSAARGL